MLFIFTYVFNSYIKKFTSLPPNDDNSYTLMFHAEGCSHCSELAPTFNKSSILGAGLSVFGELNCDFGSVACKTLNIDRVPKIIHFYNGTATEYYGLLIANAIVKWIGDFVSDTAVIVNNENYTSIKSDKQVLLFSDKASIPKVFTGTEKLVNESNIKFLFSSDKQLFADLNLKHYPGIYIKSDNGFVYYDKEISSLKLKDFITDEYSLGKKEL